MTERLSRAQTSVASHSHPQPHATSFNSYSFSGLSLNFTSSALDLLTIRLHGILYFSSVALITTINSQVISLTTLQVLW